MQKTKLGISVGLLGATIYLTGLFSGFLVPVLLAGCVLLYEENEWLRRSAVKAVAVMVFFTLLTTVLGLIPDFIEAINNIAFVFRGNFSIVLLSKIVTALVSVIEFIEKVLLVALGIKALNQGTVSVPVVDKLINKYM